MRHFFSIIVPVYNRKEEVEELLRSFQEQSYKNFEVVIVEDGSTIPCKEVVNLFEKNISIQYLYKENEGRSIARNKGMEMARGDYFVFLDSDCFAPKEYLQNLNENLSNHYVDCFGGKDMAHDSFSDLQKAINFSMTSFLTTGGIRGGKVRMEKFVPRSFNMGFSRETWEKVGGFREMFSEDIDISTRIHMKGCSISLLENVEVYHRRRTSLRKFAHQVYVFGMSRITQDALSRFFEVGALSSCCISLGVYRAVGAFCFLEEGGYYSFGFLSVFTLHFCSLFHKEDKNSLPLHLDLYDSTLWIWSRIYTGIYRAYPPKTPTKYSQGKRT